MNSDNELKCDICGTILTDKKDLQGLCPRCLLVMALGAKSAQRRKIGNYDIIGEIGRGGMGIVYKAYQVSLNRIVALKILPEQISGNNDLIVRFKREAKAAAQINHPNVVTIHEIGNDADIHYIAMEYIKGQTIDEFIKEKGQVEIKTALNIIQQVLKGLQAAHEKGIIHRDIKPQNIIIDNAGKVKLTDFGLAKMQDSSSVNLTASCSVIGTPSYMSPEQALGKDLDCRSDIFSTGLILFQMLSGKIPYSGDSPIVVLNKIINEELVAIRSFNSEVPDEVVRILNKATAKNKEDRFSSAFDMDKAIEDFLLGKTSETKMLQTPILPILTKESYDSSANDDINKIKAIDKSKKKSFSHGVNIIISILILFTGIIVIYYLAAEKKSPNIVYVRTQVQSTPTVSPQIIHYTPVQIVTNTPPKATPQSSSNLPNQFKIFPDENLDTAIRELLGKSKTDKIELGELLKLVDINLSNKNISNLSGLENLKMLAFLHFQGNPITDDSMKYLAPLRHLITLDLHNCRNISDLGLSYISENTKITYLFLLATSITDYGLLYLKNMIGLRELYLSYTMVEGKGLNVIQNFNQLEELRLQNCPIKDYALEPLGKHPYLQFLFISECYDLTDTGLSLLSQSRTLKFLNMENARQITEKGLIELTKISTLESLTIRGQNKIGLTGYQSLKNFPKLKELQIGDDKILDDERLAAVAEIKSLSILVIGDRYHNRSPISLTQNSFNILKNMNNLKLLRIPKTLFPKEKLNELNVILRNTTVIADPVDFWDYPLLKQDIPPKKL